jgi:Fe-S-cluster containining protein
LSKAKFVPSYNAHVIPSVTFDAMRRAWQILGARWEAYALVLPGDPTFVCQPSVCDAHCCRAFSVSLGAREIARMQTASRLRPERFLELEDGVPLVLPLAQPFLLARAENRCALLGPALECSQYDGRPDACRLYPHFAVAFDTETAKPLRSRDAGIDALVERVISGDPPGATVPLLLRHIECPGSTGPPMDAAEWAALFRRTAALQSLVDTPAGHG